MFVIKKKTFRMDMFSDSSDSISIDRWINDALGHGKLKLTFASGRADLRGREAAENFQNFPFLKKTVRFVMYPSECF